MNDIEIGQNVSAARTDAGLSQAALAEGMKSRGFRWSQATVWSVEKGDRPLRLNEAFYVGALLDIGPFDLLVSAEDSEGSRLVRKVGERMADVEQSAELYVKARKELLEHGPDGLSEDDLALYRIIESLPTMFPRDAEQYVKKNRSK